MHLEDSLQIPLEPISFQHTYQIFYLLCIPGQYNWFQFRDYVSFFSTRPSTVHISAQHVPSIRLPLLREVL